MNWPIPRFGVVVPIELSASNGASHQLASLYPWTSEGVQHTIKLKQVKLWPGRLEAYIVASVGPGDEIDIAFFDTLFAANRVFYKKDELYQFILVGFPYSFQISKSEPIIIDAPSKVRSLRQAMYANDTQQRESSEPLTFETKGMTALLPRPDLAADDYEFQGPVKSVTEYHAEILGQRAWRIRVTVARPGDQDFDIDLCLTEKTLGNSRLPKIGEDVCGLLWLQGYLWMPGAA